MERTLQARAAVRNMREYRPPLSGRDGNLRLDLNENTGAPSPRVVATIREFAARKLTQYPQRASVESLIAQYLNLGADQVLLTNGVDEGIHLVCETYLEPGDEVIIVVPTFSMYEIYAQSTGARTIAVRSDPASGFRFPIEEALAAISARTRLMVLANPNNPTGTVARREDLLKLAGSCPYSAVLIDEAYFEFCGETVLDAVARFPNLLVARTFSKAYGLAGLRAGILAGSSEQIAMLRRVSSPYNVNAIALACLPEAIADSEFLSGYVRQVHEGRKRLAIELGRRGVTYWNSHSNFVLAKIGPKHSEFVAEMRRRGILVRDRSSDPGCDSCVRITIGTNEDTDRLLRTLPDVLVAIAWDSSILHSCAGKSS